MKRKFFNKRCRSKVLFAAFLLSAGVSETSHADSTEKTIIIRGDHSPSLLSQIPAAEESSPEIFSVEPRLSAKDELKALLGNAEAFVQPPESLAAELPARKNQNQHAHKIQRTGSQTVGDGQ
jgi:hypothetical protein